MVRPTEARSKLAAQQAELVSALMAGGPLPSDFDAVSVHATAVSLARKRARATARAWPGLARTLGVHFGELFDEYARTTPLPREGGPLADGRAFAHWLAIRGRLPEVGRIQAMAVDLRYRVCPAGLIPRRWPAVKVVLLAQPRRLLVAIRLPWLGERWWRIPLGLPVLSWYAH